MSVKKIHLSRNSTVSGRFCPLAKAVQRRAEKRRVFGTLRTDAEISGKVVWVRSVTPWEHSSTF